MNSARALRMPWMMQRWSSIAFLHWPVDVDALRALLPDELTIDTFADQAWVGLVPFHMTIRPPYLPPIPGVSTFPEINVRAYVRDPRGLPSGLACQGSFGRRKRDRQGGCRARYMSSSPEGARWRPPPRSESAARAPELASYCVHALAGAGAQRSKAAVRRLVSVTLDGLRPPS